MEKLEMKKNAWLREHLIPRLAGVFQEQCRPEDMKKVECTVTRPKDSFFLSDLFFVTIRFLSGSNRERSLLIKLPSQDPKVRERQNYDFLFANEMLFYEKVVDNSSDFPLCYLSGDDPVFTQVIVLENVTSRGYLVCPQKTNLQFDYLLASLRAIARFHGHTYTLKERNPKKFHEIVDSIVKIRYDSDEEKVASYAEEVNKRISRVSEKLLARGKRKDGSSDCDPIFAERMAKLFEDCYASVLRPSAEPREPLATIVHGDCTVNNILYRRRVNYEGGPCYDAMLVDFALIMYSSPATDVSTFLYMSASPSDVKGRFRELFQAYHDALSQYLKEQKVWNPVKYSYDAFLQDYKRTAIFGYVIATFFLPMMTEYASNNNLLDDVDEAIERLNITGGGEALSNQLVDTLIDMREAGLLDYYVNNQPD